MTLKTSNAAADAVRAPKAVKNPGRKISSSEKSGSKRGQAPKSASAEEARAKGPKTKQNKKISSPASVSIQPAPVSRTKRPGKNQSQQAKKSTASESKKAAAAPGKKPLTPAAAQDPGKRSPGNPEQQGRAHSFPVPDFEVLARNVPRILEEGGKALMASMKSIEEGNTNPDLLEHAADAVKTLGLIAEYWLADPDRALRAQQSLTDPLIALWGETWHRLSGETPKLASEPIQADKRFADPQWRDNPVYDFLRQAYTITSDWANYLVQEADDVDALSRDKAAFYIRQIIGALSPSNYLPTNPELLRKTLEENGENLVRGLIMLVEDIETGKGQLKIRQSDASKFVLGRDMAMSPGKVIYRNDLMELIQYSPSTPDVYKRPLLIVPPWINKFYVLDLNPEKSFVRYCAENGLTVFLISWVNPDERHADKSFEDYMREGIFGALDAIKQATGERDVSAIGYCVGGTLLAITLAYMAATGDKRISSATLFTTQVDFTDAGDLKLFVDAARIKALEERMRQTGYLEGSKMAAAFNMLRPNELIWGFFVNNYLKGNEPMPFDLLAWNSDSTRMPAANHSFYLRNCYLNNTLTRGEMVIAGKKLDLSQVTIPVYNLAAREDHIAPAKSVFNGAKFFGGEMRYILSGSGHIAGVVNPASKPKYQFWTGPAPRGDFETWVATATEHPGSWWNDWISWVTAQAREKVPARIPGEGKLKAICDAPGEYVRVKS